MFTRTITKRCSSDAPCWTDTSQPGTEAVSTALQPVGQADNLQESGLNTSGYNVCALTWAEGFQTWDSPFLTESGCIHVF